MNKGRICAVVVTYNRKKMLLETLEALINQNHMVNGIYIVDNASTDGTERLLFENGFIKTLPSFEKNITKIFIENKYFYRNTNIEIHFIKMPKNIGGAGGFFEGIKKGYEHGYDWMWVMDDDVICQKSTLKNMLLASELINERVGFFCSRVIGENGISMNVPTVDTRNGENFYPTWDKRISDGYIKVQNATFVSVMVNRSIIEDIGLPLKEMFIWGDDTEYTTRISEKFPCYMVGNSVVIHKRKQQKGLNILFESDKKRINNFYYFYRNGMFFRRKYLGSIYSIKFILKGLLDLVNILKTKNRLLKAKVLIKGIISGLFFNPKIKFPK